MILRPIDPPSASSEAVVPAWPILERIQRQHYESCWLVTQPSHAALAGELAAKMELPHVPKPDAKLLQAIALHDAGWGPFDAEIIQHCRSDRSFRPASFLETPLAHFLNAWKRSIETAQSVSAAGGYIVSRHFHRLGEHRVATSIDQGPDKREIESFVQAESSRQKKLAAKQQLSLQELELLTDLLQLCDLLSLYVCIGPKDKALISEYFGIDLQVNTTEQGVVLDPSIIPSGTQFRVAALLHPAQAGTSSKEILIQIA
ncbi:MAG TPA: DUF3891 family protein [Candidatus Angelobacter sp.]|nr:DUF3891 family protein [Candidatus Angelobacter sp.]